METEGRVLILTPDFPPAPGGIQLLVHRLAATMSRVEPIVVAPAAARARAFDSGSRVSVRRIAHPPGDHRATIMALNVAAAVLARRLKPDVVLSAHIVTSPAAAAIRRQLGVPVVQYLYANEVGSRPGLTAFALQQSDAVIAISRHTADLAIRGGAKGPHLHLIPPGVDLPPRETHSRAERPTVITVARLEDRYKGHDMVVRALPLVRAQVPDVEWIVIGGGPRKHELERLAAIYQVSDNIRFLGAVADADRNAWLERAHVFTLPSRIPGDGQGGEGFGIVYLEAGWRELPVVAGNAGGAVDAVVDRETGMLVDANDPVAIASALTYLLRNPAFGWRLGQQGALRAREFAWPIITRRVEDLLLSLVKPPAT